MNNFIVVLAVLALAGCATPGGGSGDKGLQNALRSEIARQYAVVGVDPAKARDVRITVNTCEPKGQNGDGPYVCADSPCARLPDGCVHAWQMSYWHSDNTEFMFAGMPNQWTINHEVWHFTMRRWGDDPNEQLPRNGHPEKVHIQGRVYSNRDVIGGARWPAIVRGLQFWKPKAGAGFGCATLDGDGRVITRQQIPEGMDGDGI